MAWLGSRWGRREEGRCCRRRGGSSPPGYRTRVKFINRARTALPLKRLKGTEGIGNTMRDRSFAGRTGLVWAAILLFYAESVALFVLHLLSTLTKQPTNDSNVRKDAGQ